MLSTTVLLRTGLLKMWLTGRICGPAQLLLVASGFEIYFKASFNACNFFTKKTVFVKFVDASSLFHIALENIFHAWLFSQKR